jgi:serine/threonine protein kinase/tetratricopeptide (TPR) repeat protein
MIVQRSQRIETLFASAVELAPEKREAFLNAECADDQALRSEVESLLDAYDRAGRFIEEPALEMMAAAQSGDRAEPEWESGDEHRIGPYKLIRRIGAGGMGEVYLAARADDQYQKQVAIKLVRRGLDTDLIIRRFRYERQILANLDHHNIARLIDGGVTADGLPWLALEYVDGEPIDLYCDKHRLTIAERLELFRKVCEAVQYAHSNLVVHRDLKPSNILITEDGAPKLLDFGIAKILAPQIGEQTADQTSSILRLMTPSYASPEQIKGGAITTASDVYSLGVILYELLTGHRPYHLTGRLPHEVMRIACEETPMRPSLAVARLETATDGGTETDITPEQVSRARYDQPDRLRRRLAGDIDNIVMTALRKEPERRYQSVEQFSEDIQRHLARLPVSASKDTFAYRGKKFVQRRKAIVALCAITVFSLLTGIILAMWQARAARTQERMAKEQATAAQQERDKARRISEFLRTTLSFANPANNSPGHGKAPDIKLVDAIKDAEKRIDTELKDQPEIRGELHYTLGRIWRQRGENDSAETQFRAALDLFRQLYGQGHPRAILSLHYLSLIEGTKTGDGAATMTAIRRAIEMMRQNDPQNGDLPLMLLDLARSLGYHGGYAEAEALILEAREAFRKMKGTEDDFSVAYTYCRLGDIYRDQGELERAEETYFEYLERLRRLPAKYEAAEALFNLGVINYARGYHREAEKLLNEAKNLCREYLGESYLTISRCLYYLASIHCRQRNYVSAEAEARRALEIALQKNGPDHAWTIVTQGLLSKVLISAGQAHRANPYLIEAIKKFGNTQNRSIGEWFSAAGILGECLILLKRYDKAEAYLNESYRAFRPGPGCKGQRRGALLIEACGRLASLYEAWGKPDQAARYRL